MSNNKQNYFELNNELKLLIFEDAYWHQFQGEEGSDVLA